MIFNGFRRQVPDKLNMAHSIGGGAVALIEDLVNDLDEASNLAMEVVTDSQDQITELLAEQSSAAQAALRYTKTRDKLSALVA